MSLLTMSHASCPRRSFRLPAGYRVLFPLPHLPRSGLRSYVAPALLPMAGMSYMIQTLDPSRLVPSDFIDLSLKCGIRIRPLHSRKSIWFAEPDQGQFPAEARGFLYYHPPTGNSPPAAGEIRFRLTSGDNPESFQVGRDFQDRKTGFPWRIPLLVMTEDVRKYTPFRQLLLADGFVTPAFMRKCNEMTKALGYRVQRNSAIIHSLGHLFHFEFTKTGMIFLVLTKKNLHRIRLPGFFAHPVNHRGFKSSVLYSGSALCCFEQSTLPKHRGTRTVVLRIVKIISPAICKIPNYDGYIPSPIEGELVPHRTGPRTWSLNVDKARNPSWKALYGEDDES